jgi:hypothetical protein
MDSAFIVMPSRLAMSIELRCRAPYRLAAGMSLIAAANFACAAGSTGLCLTLVLAGSLPRKLSPFQFFDGLIGLGTNAPPQFGQTFSRRLSTQPAQNVHSYVQMRASSESAGRALLHCSHVGRSSSIVCLLRSLMDRDSKLRAAPGTARGWLVRGPTACGHR